MSSPAVVTCYACGHQIGRGGYRWERVGDVEAPRCRSSECMARTGWPFLASSRKPPRLCGHCGERIVTVVRCAVCGADLSDLAYHSGEQYAVETHLMSILDDSHLDALDRADAPASSMSNLDRQE